MKQFITTKMSRAPKHNTRTNIRMSIILQLATHK